MTFIDLFAGVGGFRKGMELAGHECKGFCEWDKYAAASYISMHLITEEQRAYLATLDKKKRQKEILKDEYLNGEWYSNDIRNVDARSIPKVDCFCFGAPCQDFSIAGQRKGLEGDRSSLIREVFRVIREEREEDRPEWLIYENVKGMLSSNRGGDFLSILMEMDELGYDTEWQIFNSKNWGVPQNRERVYTLGHFRAKGRKKVFPIGTTDGKDNLQVGQIGQIEARRDNPQRYRVYSERGVSPCLNTMGGGGNMITVKASQQGIGGGYDVEPLSDGKGLPRNRESRNGSGDVEIIGKTNPNRHSTADIHSIRGIITTMCGRDYKQPKQIAIPIEVSNDRDYL